MSFASVLNAYCMALGCTSREIAERCGISASALSRYRSGERTPDVNGVTVRKIARGITELASIYGVRLSYGEAGVLNNLQIDLINADKASVRFAQRLDAIMDALAVRNSDLARSVDSDPSYISRIRNGQRSPGNPPQFAAKSAKLLARRCVEQGSVDALDGMVGVVQVQRARMLSGAELQMYLEEVLTDWLLGEAGDYTRDDTYEQMLRLVDSYDSSIEQVWRTKDDANLDLPKVPNSTKQCYYGLEGLRTGDLVFLQNALAKEAKEIFIYSDMPFDETTQDADFLKKRHALIAALIRNGARVDVIHNFDRPFNELLRGMEYWMPMYMSGRVHGYILDGVHNRVFCRLGCISEKCVLSSEAVSGYVSEGRCCYSEDEEDVRYHRRKVQRIFQAASPFVEVFREDDANEFALFESMEEARRQSGKCIERTVPALPNLKFVMHQGECLVITKSGEVTTHFVVRHAQTQRVVDSILNRLSI